MENKCSKCGVDMTEEMKCTCKPEVCKGCCECEAGCTCGCKEAMPVEEVAPEAPVVE